MRSRPYPHAITPMPGEVTPTFHSVTPIARALVTDAHDRRSSAWSLAVVAVGPPMEAGKSGRGRPQNAEIPVIVWPRMREWMSWVPS